MVQIGIKIFHKKITEPSEVIGILTTDQKKSKMSLMIMFI